MGSALRLAVRLTLAVGMALAGTTAAASAAGPGENILVSRPTGPLTDLAPGLTNTSTTSSIFSGGSLAGLSDPGDSVSSDGRYVVFTSQADALLGGGDDKHFAQVFVRDTQANTTEAVSRSDGAGGPLADADAVNPAISDDGTRVAFVTAADLSEAGVNDANGTADVYVRDLGADTTRLVSRQTSADAPTATASTPSISADGKEIAFATTAGASQGFAAADTNVDVDVYLRNMTDANPANHTTTLVSRATGDAGAVDSLPSTLPAVSDDGLRVAFTTDNALDAVADDNLTTDVYLRDLGANPDTTELVSRASDTMSESGDVGDGFSSYPAISGDGTVVGFYSEATNLVAGDTLNHADIFVRDLSADPKSTFRVSVGDDEAEGNDDALYVALSADGKEVAFSTFATNMGNGDASFDTDVHVRDLTAGTTELASRVGAAGASGDDESDEPAISGDGAVVTFYSRADNLSPDDDDDFQQVFHRSLGGDATTWVSRPDGTGALTGDGMNSSFLNLGGRPPEAAASEDGRYVAFSSSADSISPDDDDRLANAFVRDTLKKTTTLVNVASDGTPASGGFVGSVSISADGSRVAFESSATNLVAGDNNGRSDIFVHDLDTSTTELVSRRGGLAGTIGNGSSFEPAISADGDRVAFDSDATNLHPDGPGSDANGSLRDIYVRDLSSDTTLLASRADGAAGAQANATDPVLDADGTHVAFRTISDNLDPTVVDTSAQDIYVRDLGADTTRLASRADGAAGLAGNNSSQEPSISADGSRVAFSSAASNLGDGDVDFLVDVHVRDMGAGTTSLVSQDQGGNSIGQAREPAISGAGDRVAFQTTNPAVAADTNGAADIYLRNLTAATTSLISRESGPGAVGTGSSLNPSISPNGDCVAFDSQGENLTDDYPGFDFSQVYLRVVSGECPNKAPQTTIKSGPSGRTGDRTPTFGFKSNEPGSDFECKLDGGGFENCDSPERYGRQGFGRHTFQVRATDAAGNTDKSPAKRSFKIVR